MKLSKQRKEKQRRQNQMDKIAKSLGALYIYIYIYIDNFIKNKLYIKYKRLKINLMYKLYMVGFLCPPKVQMD